MRKILFMLIVIVSITILGCNDTDDTKDNNNYQNREKSKSVSGVTALITSNNKYVIVSWEAIENGAGYNVYIQQENKKSIISTTNMIDDVDNNWIQAQNKYAYATADGAKIANQDIDKWSVRIPTSNLWTNAKYRFGVTSYEFDDYKSASDIVWSSYIQYTK